MSHSAGGEIKFLDGVGTPLSSYLKYTAWAKSAGGVETGTKNLYATGNF
jgi:hypothetical protein